MDFRPSTIINTQRQSTHTCTIDKCMICPLKRTCSHYLEHLENRVSQQNNKIESSGMDTKELMLYIETLNNRINELTEVVVNTLNTPHVPQNGLSHVLDEKSIDSAIKLENDFRGTTETNTAIDPMQINNTTIASGKQEEIIAQENETGLTIFDSSNKRRVLQEKRSFFTGKPTGKFKEVKVK